MADDVLVPHESGEPTPHVLSPTLASAIVDSGRRRKPYQRITHTEIVRVLDFHAKGIKQVEIARSTGLSEQRVSQIIKEFEPTEEYARLKLRAAAGHAAEQWADVAVSKAAKRGDSSPAERLLKAVGVVQPDAPSQVTVNVGVGVMTSVLNPFAALEAKALGESPSDTSVGRPTITVTPSE